MFSNYLKTALRNIWKHKGFSLINIIGLAVGISVFSLIMFYVHYETNADKYNENYERIYRVNVNEKYGVTSLPLAGYLKEQVPEIENTARLYPYARTYIMQNNEPISCTFCVTDPSIFDIFSLRAVSGDLHTALSDPNSIVLSESFSKKVFGDEDPIGQLLNIEDEYDLTVTAIIEDNTTRSSLVTNDGIISFDFAVQSWKWDDQNWYWNNYVTYLLVNRNVDHADFIAKMDQFFLNDEYTSWFDEDQRTTTLYLSPLKDIYFDDSKFDYSLHGNKQTVKIFFASGIFIILIVCINFINLSTAGATKRAKEIGMRKTIGAQKKNILLQFLGESIVICFAASLLAILFIALIFPSLKELFRIHMPIATPVNIIFYFVFVMLLGTLAGLYPALYYTSILPIRAFRGEQIKGNTGAASRKVLTVIQFVVAIFLIIGTIIIYKQLYYISHKDMGFDKDSIVTFTQAGEIKDKQEVFKDALLKNSNIKSVSYTYTKLGYVILQHGLDIGTYKFYTADEDFVDTYGIEIVRGRDFLKHSIADSNAILINETAARELDWQGRDPIGLDVIEGLEIVGIMKDFSFRKLQYRIEPFVVHNSPGETHIVNVKITPNNIDETLEFIEKTYKEFVPTEPFSAAFLEDELALLYRAEIRFGKLFKSFTILAIILSCMGMFGLSLFMTEQRTKEIGVRKVLGSSIHQIIVLLSSDFLKWVLLSAVIASPIAYFIMKKWLEGFAYKTEINIWIFIISGLIALFISLITVSFQTFKAANTNPADIIKYE
jgi:putative ABC transport system permease protein